MQDDQCQPPHNHRLMSFIQTLFQLILPVSSQLIFVLIWILSCTVFSLNSMRLPVQYTLNHKWTIVEFKKNNLSKHPNWKQFFFITSDRHSIRTINSISIHSSTASHWYERFVQWTDTLASNWFVWWLLVLI